MSQTVSEGSAKPYGVERVCDVWEQARSTFYDRQERVQKLAQGIKPGKRGPKPYLSDAELLDLIRRDLAASPFRGEGHRKVWGRLHFGQGLRVSRKRVLRLMRENQLLSPYRGRQGAVLAGCRAPRSDSARSGRISLPGRRAPQGVGAVALRARTTSVSQAGASAHAGEPTAVPLPWATGRTQSPQRYDHHGGSEPHVGNRRYEGVHA